MTPLLAARLRMVERSARVRRYHTEPTLHVQSVGEHTYAVMWLVLLLTNQTASRDLLLGVLMHDSPEHEVGDIPAPTKRLTGMKAAFDALEDGVMAEIALTAPVLTDEEAALLKYADLLEGVMFCGFEARRGNRDIQMAFNNYLTYTTQLWNVSEQDISHEAWTLVGSILQHYQERYCEQFRK